MSKISQREILSEGFWDSFSSVAKMGAETVKQVGSIVAPEIADPLKKGIDKFRSVRASIQEAGKPWQIRIKDWVIEQGRHPIPDAKHIKKIKTYPDGKTHYALKVAEKGQDKTTGEEIPGREYRNPNSVVAYNPTKNAYEWIIKPRADNLKKEKRADGHTYNVFYNNNSNVDGYGEQIDMYQHP
jgi:hypothetical protein